MFEIFTGFGVDSRICEIHTHSLHIAYHVGKVTDEKRIIGECLGEVVYFIVIISYEAKVIVVLHEVPLEETLGNPK